MKNKKIKLVINKIVELLIVADEKVWLKTFHYFLMNIDVKDPRLFLNEIKSIYGGMGSFNDLVLYDNGEVLQKENNELSSLRKELYELLD